MLLPLVKKWGLVRITPRISFLSLVISLVTTVISFLSIVMTSAVKRLLIVLLLHRKLKLFSRPG